MKFEYNAAPQRTPEWFTTRIGRVTASRLEDWLSTSKAKATLGKPLKARLDYEKELIYERQFGVSYNNYVTEAMLDGMELEGFAVQQYELITGNATTECGIWYSNNFGASPDRVVMSEVASKVEAPVSFGVGILEVKILRDSAFTELLLNDPTTSHAYDTGEVDAKGQSVMRGTGVPEKHWKQIQGQLMASGKKWCDYVALNLNTRKVKIIRVMPDPEFFEYLEAALSEDLVTAQFSLEGVHDIRGDVPSWGDTEHTPATTGEW